jgi:hypothetical protein
MGEPAAIDANPMMAQSTKTSRMVVEGRLLSSKATTLMPEQQPSGGKQKIMKGGLRSLLPNTGPTKIDENTFSAIEKKPRATRNGTDDPKARRDIRM